MAKENRSCFAVLGMLHFGEMTGYEIKKGIGAGIGRFWQEASASVYPALKALGRDGLVDSCREIPETGPARVRYRLTDAGRNAFSEWLRREPGPTAMRNEFALKLFFGKWAEPGRIRAFIDAEETRDRRLLAGLDELARTVSLADGDAMSLLVLDYGRSIAEATVAWCEKAKNRLDAARDDAARDDAAASEPREKGTYAMESR